MKKIIVPASSANLGPGFDSLGLAVDRYLTLEVLEKTANWQIEHDLAQKFRMMKQIWSSHQL